MRFLITRSDADAGPTISRLVKDGHKVVHEPLLKIKKGPDADRPASHFIDGAQALIATSANGVRAIGLWHQAKGMPLYAVGAGTAQVAAELGFSKIVSADGDVNALIALIAEKCLPNAGPLVHVAGKNRAGDLKADLEAKGFTVRRAVLYHAKRSHELGSLAKTAIAQQGLDGVLLFSPRTADIFVELVEKAGLTDKLATLRAYVLSNNVAARLKGVPLKEIVVAQQATLDSLMAALPTSKEPQQAFIPPTITSVDRPVSKPEKSPKGRVYPAQQMGPTSGEDKAKAMPTPSDKKPDPVAAANPSQTKAAQPQPTAKKPAAAKKQKKPGRTGWYVAGVLGLVMAANAATLYTLPQWPQSVRSAMGLMPPAASNDQQLGALTARLDGLEAQLARLQAGQSAKADQSSVDQSIAALQQQFAAQGEAAPADPSAAEADGAQLAALQTTVAELQSVQAAMLEEMAKPRTAELDDATKSRLAGYDARLTALTEQAALALAQSQSALDKSGTANARLLAFAAVERAAQSGDAFATEWAAAAPLLTSLDAAAATRLAEMAETGVIAMPTLSKQFDSLISEALRLSNMPEDASWWQKLWAQLKGIVTVRRIGGDDGAGPASRLARAESALESNDLAKAIEEIEGLQGPAAEWLHPWLTQARQRSWLDAQLRSLRVALLNVEG